MSCLSVYPLTCPLTLHPPTAHGNVDPGMCGPLPGDGRWLPEPSRCPAPTLRRMVALALCWPSVTALIWVRSPCATEVGMLLWGPPGPGRGRLDVSPAHLVILSLPQTVPQLS